MEANTAMNLFSNIYQKLTAILECVDFRLAQSVYLALSRFIDNVQSKEAAENSYLMQRGVELLDLSKEDGSEDALLCHDAICGYLAVVGVLL